MEQQQTKMGFPGLGKPFALIDGCTKCVPNVDGRCTTLPHVTPFHTRRGDTLKNRYIPHFCHQRLDPMKEAPSNEGGFSCFSDTPIGKV